MVLDEPRYVAEVFDGLARTSLGCSPGLDLAPTRVGERCDAQEDAVDIRRDGPSGKIAVKVFPVQRQAHL
jgi:hypothetical protein